MMKKAIIAMLGIVVAVAAHAEWRLAGVSQEDKGKTLVVKVEDSQPGKKADLKSTPRLFSNGKSYKARTARQVDERGKGAVLEFWFECKAPYRNAYVEFETNGRTERVSIPDNKFPGQQNNPQRNNMVVGHSDKPVEPGTYQVTDDGKGGLHFQRIDNNNGGGKKR